MKKDYLVYIQDMIDSIQHIETYTKKLTIKKLATNDIILDAVIRRFEILGEAAKSIPEDIRKNYPTIPWRSTTGMRDILIHNYNEVNTTRLWQTIKHDLPHLKKQLEQILKETS